MLMSELDERIDEIMGFKTSLPRGGAILSEFSGVKLRTAQDGYSAMTPGTIVDIHGAGIAYEVEMREPKPGVITVRHENLIPEQ